MTVYDYGVDLNFNLDFKDGDLILSEYDDNIRQAIYNRLKTLQGSLDLFYYDYGGLFLHFLGWKRVKETLNIMKVELDKTLRQDTRINNFTTSLSYNDDGSVNVKIILKDFKINELNFVLSNNGVTEE